MVGIFQAYQTHVVGPSACVSQWEIKRTGCTNATDLNFTGQVMAAMYTRYVTLCA